MSSPAAVSAIAAVLLLFFIPSAISFRPWPPAHSNIIFGSSKKLVSSPLINVKYHNGRLLTSNITLNLIWYGEWASSEKRIIRDFIDSISDPSALSPSVYQWWNNVRLYTDSSKNNITGSVSIGGEKNDGGYSRGKYLSREAIELVIKDAIKARTKPLASTPGTVYAVLTSANVSVERFCQSSCGYHDVTKKALVGVEVPYLWVGNSGTQCAGMCSFPYAVPSYVKDVKPVNSPNGNGPVDGMVIVLGHELVELSTDTYTTGWFHGKKVYPQEVADLCEGIYGSGGGGSYPGQMINMDGATFNVHGKRRRFTVPWIWSRYRKQCWGANAVE